MNGNTMLDANFSLTRIIDAAIMTATLLFNAAVLDADWQSLSVAVGGSISGSIILAYFRRVHQRGEQFFKVIASAIGGLVLGTVLQKYFTIESDEYRLGLFFACSMLALIILRSLLSLTENNVADLIRNLLQRIFNLQLKEEKTRKRVERLEKFHEKEGKDNG